MPTAKQVKVAVRATKYVHSNYFKTEVESRTREGELVLLAPPDELMRDAHLTLTQMRRKADSILLPDARGLNYLDKAWRRKVRDEIGAIIDVLQDLDRRLR